MPIIHSPGPFSVGGLPRNNAAVSLWGPGTFSSQPAKNTAVPLNAILFATTLTGPIHGYDGAYSFTVSSSGEYWVSVAWNGQTTWDYHNVLAAVVSLNIRDYGAHSIDEVGFSTFDSAPAIQAAINDSVASSAGRAKVVLPRGKWRIDTSLVAYRVSAGAFQFITVDIEGDGSTNQDLAGGIEIIPSFNDKPALIIQFARSCRVKDIVFTGLNDLQTFSGFGGTNYSALLDNDNFVSGSCRDNRYSPYCAIAIDPFHNSVAAVNQYPGLSAYYAYTGGNGGSSRIELWNIHARRFVVNYMITSAPTVQQGDAVYFYNCQGFYCKTNIAVGQSQSRVVTLFGGDFGWSKFFINGTEYGQQTGPMPNIFGTEVISTKYLFSNPANFGCAAIQGLYCESTHSMGWLGQGASSTAEPLSFDGCSINFTTGTGLLRPDFHIINTNPVIFNGCFFKTNEYVMSVFSGTHSPIVYNACKFQLNTSSSGETHYASANIFTGQEKFNDCEFQDSVLGPVGGRSVVGLTRMEFDPTNNQFDGSLLRPGSLFRFQSINDVVTGPGAFQTVDLGHCTVTHDLSGTATFATSGTNIDIIQVGDLIHTLGDDQLTVEAQPGAGAGALKINNIYIGQVQAIDTNTLTVTITGCPQSLPATSTQRCEVVWMGRFHQDTIGDVTSGSVSIINVSPIGNWKAGQRIRGTGIVAGNYIVNVASTTITLARAATVTTTGTAIFDAQMRRLYPLLPTSMATLLGTWGRFDISTLASGADTEIINTNTVGATGILGATMPFAGFVTDLSINLPSDIGGAGANLIATVYKNGVATSLTITLAGAGGTETKKSGSISVPFVANDVLTVYAQIAGSPNAIQCLVNVWGFFRT